MPASIGLLLQATLGLKLIGSADRPACDERWQPGMATCACSSLAPHGFYEAMGPIKFRVDWMQTDSPFYDACCLQNPVYLGPRIADKILISLLLMT